MCPGYILGKEPTHCWKPAVGMGISTWHRKQGKQLLVLGLCRVWNNLLQEGGYSPTFQPETETKFPWLVSWIVDLLYSVNPSDSQNKTWLWTEVPGTWQKQYLYHQKMRRREEVRREGEPRIQNTKTYEQI